MNKLIFLIALFSFSPLVNNSNTSTIALPNQFNGIPFSIENVIHIETLDSSIVVSCVIEKDLNFVDLISNYQSLRKIYGHGTIELNHNMDIIKSRFYLFKIKNAPDRFIYVTPENDPIPNTILADHVTAVDGETHMDSIMQTEPELYFDHFENSIVYRKGMALDFERKEFIVLDTEDPGDGDDPFYYEEDLFIQPLEEDLESTLKVYWEKAYDPISFYEGQVFGFHHLVNKEDKAQKLSHFLNHEINILDSEGYLIQSYDLYWEKPLFVSNAIKVYESEKLSKPDLDAVSVLYLLREQSHTSTKSLAVPGSYHVIQFDKRGNELMSVPFESDLIEKHKNYGMSASQEDEQVLLSEFILRSSGASHTVRASFHWFNSHKLVNADSRRITFEIEPVFKDDPILHAKHRGSFDLDRNMKCVVYEMEETTEIHLGQLDQKDYYKTWFAFLVFNEQCEIVDFSMEEGFIPSDKKAHLSVMPCSEDELVFSLVRPDYFTNSSKIEVIAQDLTLVKINKSSGRIQHYEADLDIELRQ